MTDESQVDWADTAEGKACISELCEARLQHYREHLESAFTVEELQQRMQERMAEWKAARQIELLEQRWQAYLADPSTATTWEKVQERMHAHQAERRAQQGHRTDLSGS